MGGGLKKFWNMLLGVSYDDDEYYEDEYYDDEYYYEEGDNVVPITQSVKSNTSKRGTSNLQAPKDNVVDLYKKKQLEVLSPKSIEDAREIILNIKSEVVTFVDLKPIDASDAQRIVDFLCGAVDALDGKIHRFSEDTFIVADGNTIISNPADSTRTRYNTLSGTGRYEEPTLLSAGYR